MCALMQRASILCVLDLPRACVTIDACCVQLRALKALPWFLFSTLVKLVEEACSTDAEEGAMVHVFFCSSSSSVPI